MSSAKCCQFHPGPNVLRCVFGMTVFETNGSPWAGPIKFDPGQVKIIIDYIRREIFWTFLGD